MTEQAASPTSVPTDPHASERELEVARELVTGTSNAEITRTLIISPHTVKVHVRNIFEKLEVNSRTEATMVLLQKGWVTVPGVSPVSDEELIPDARSLDDVAIRPFAWQHVYMLGALVLVLLALWAPTLNSRSAEPVDLLSDSSLGVIGAPVVTTLPRWEAAYTAHQRTQPPGRRSARRDALCAGRSPPARRDARSGHSVRSALKPVHGADAPALPEPVANLAAAALNGHIYVAGGSRTDASGATTIYDNFWRYTPGDRGMEPGSPFCRNP